MICATDAEDHRLVVALWLVRKISCALVESSRLRPRAR
ncbi:hypothetical protein NKDENANG_01043 [Candidatus Entotheonellaceae bacterium PAL068K]